MRIGNLFRRSEDSRSDWALLQLDSNPSGYSNKFLVHPQSKGGTDLTDKYVHCERVAPQIVDSDVYVATGRVDTIQGYISATPTFIKLPGYPNFLKMWLVGLNEPLSKLQIPNLRH